MLVTGLFFSHNVLLPFKDKFFDPEKKSFENIVRKRENAGNQHFLFFPQCFLNYLRLGWLYWGLTPL